MLPLEPPPATPTTTSISPPAPVTPAPPVTVTQTVTSTPAPTPIEVKLEQPGGDAAVWVPIATLVAALIAAIFLTINETLKRHREDRRQWDREIRDICVSCMTAADTIVSTLSLKTSAEMEREINKWQSEVESIPVMSAPAAFLSRIDPRGKRSRDAYEKFKNRLTDYEKMVYTHVQNIDKRSDSLKTILSNYEVLSLIAHVDTANAAARLHAVCRAAIAESVSTPSSEKRDLTKHIADIESARLLLVSTVRSDLRSLHAIPTVHHEKLISDVFYYRFLPNWAQDVYYRRRGRKRFEVQPKQSTPATGHSGS